MGADPPNPSPRELPLSNRTWFSSVAELSDIVGRVSPKWEKSNFIEDVRIATALYEGFLPRLGPPTRVASLLCDTRIRSSTGLFLLAGLLSGHTGCRSDDPRRGDRRTLAG